MILENKKEIQIIKRQKALSVNLRLFVVGELNQLGYKLQSINYVKNLILLIPLLVLVLSCHNSNEGASAIQIISGHTMGTTYTVKALATQTKKNILKEKIDKLLGKINSAMSTYDKRSELSLLNMNLSKDWIKISDELKVVLEAAIEVNKMSKGGFDVTIGPLVNLWGFGPQYRKKVPSSKSIDDARKFIGMDKLTVDLKNHRIKKLYSNIYIDLSAVAKGYGVDCVGRLLEESGINNYMVEIGGEIRTRGEKSSGPWKILIESPTNDGMGSEVLEMGDISIATSGSYRNYFESNGKKFSHAIDQITGRPVSHELISVSVLHQSCMMADAIATALLVLGPKRGERMADEFNIGAYFIYKSNGLLKMKKTKNFRVK